MFSVESSLLAFVAVTVERADKRELGRMLQLVLGCAVNCDDKHEYIRRIMNMEEAVQHDVMKAIQEVRQFMKLTNFSFVVSLLFHIRCHELTPS